jgi:predicted flap endonuclease-1-like 5' DNA nuclease
MLTSLNDFLQQIPGYVGIIGLMFSTFLIGYFSASLLLKRKYRALSDKLKKEVNELRSRSQQQKDNIDSLFTEIKPKIIEVVKQTQEARSQQNNPKQSWPEELDDEANEEETAVKPQSVAQKARATFIKYNIDKPELDFESIGYADHDQKDDLTRIMGIGPYIEQKLNEIGICNYEQISRLSEADIQTITELIDFFPGRIERDNWVGQARSLMVS